MLCIIIEKVVANAITPKMTMKDNLNVLKLKCYLILVRKLILAELKVEFDVLACIVKCSVKR